MGRKKESLENNSLYIFSPVLKFLPEVSKPKKKVRLQERVFYTVMSLFIYLVMCQIPVYGIEYATGADPIYWMRVIMASTHGTLMELGITPLVTTSLVMQLLAGIGALKTGDSPKEQALFDGAQKFVGLCMTLIQAVLYVMMGMYGPIREIGMPIAIMIILQLFLAGVICILLDELLQKGHGLGSGTSLFIATNICETVLWKSFSPSTITTHKGTEFEGAIIALFHMLLTKEDKLRALQEGLYRSGMPNITNLMATAVIFVIVIFFQGWKTELTIKPKQVKGSDQSYPIKLFYTSNMPIILQSSLLSNFFMLSQMLHQRFGDNIIVNIVGRWTTPEYTSSRIPIGGLVYYISPPGTISDMVADPIHSFTYVSFMLLSCAFFSYIWISISGSSSKDVAQKLLQNGMVIKGHETPKSMEQHLEKYIPISAAFGGMCIGALTLFADLLGALGSGTGILLAVTIIHQYYEVFLKEGEDLWRSFTSY